MLHKICSPFILVFSLFFLDRIELFASNNPPKIINLSLEADTVQKKLIILFDLFDNENDTITVSLKASNDKGETYLVDITNVEGDIDIPILRGKGKRVVWNYAENISDISTHIIKLIARDTYKIKTEDLLNQVDIVNLKNNLQSIYGERNHRNEETTKHLENVKNTIEKHFKSNGLQTNRQTAGDEIGYPIQNVLGRKAGQNVESKTYILCAHFDTAPKSPGADDNGSGVAGMLEAMRILSKYNFDFTIQFIGFDYEERGMGGSYLYTSFKGIKEYEYIHGAINLDMIGFFSNSPNSQIIPTGFEHIFPEAVQAVKKDDSKGNFAICTSNTASLSFGNKFVNNAQKYVPELKLIMLEAPDDGSSTPTLVDSDHASFWNMGYRAIQIGDGGDTRNIYMDTDKDIMKNINYSFTSNIVKATIATIVEFAQIQNSTSISSSVTIKSN